MNVVGVGKSNVALPGTPLDSVVEFTDVDVAAILSIRLLFVYIKKELDETWVQLLVIEIKR